jgi:uncharacterized protein YegP (UPF0339 family)
MKRLSLISLVYFALLVAWPTTEESAPSHATRSAQTDGPALTFEIYQDRAATFRWRLNAQDGQVVATSGRAYAAKADCQGEIGRIQSTATLAHIEDLSAKGR